MARGSVRRKDNSWSYRVDLGPDPSTGRRRQLAKQGFRTKREAERALDEVLHAVPKGGTPSRSAITLEEYLDQWLEAQRPRIRPTTWYGYAMAVKRLSTGLGKLRLQALTSAQIEAFYSSQLATGRRDGLALSPKTVRNTHVVLRRALADAERLELASRNAAAAARAPTIQRLDRPTWTSDDLKEFLASVSGHRLYAAFVLLATTGMRRGEALGLRWTDLDFDAGELSIANTITTAGIGPLIMGPPKTARSRRQVFLDDATLAVLREHRRRQGAERLAVGPAWDARRPLVFCDELGAPIRPDWFSREFHRLLRRAGLPEIRLHDIRHTYATLALKAGMHPKVVSERLGHATVGITLDLYSHVTPSIARDAADVVASRIL